MSANTERTVQARGIPAWHNENTTTIPADAMTFEDICRYVPQMEMPVSPHQMFWLDDRNVPHLVPDFVANVRSDGTYVGCVGEGYQAVQGAEFFGILAELIRPNGEGLRECIADTAGTLNRGRLLYIACLAPREFYVGDDAHEAHRHYLTALNSFDSSTKVGITLSTVRTVCNNTFNANLADHEAAYWYRHTANVQDRIEEARQALTVAGRYWVRVETEMNQMARARFSSNDFNQLVNAMDWADPAKLEAAGNKRAAANAEREREELNLLWVTPDGNFEGTAYKAMQAIIAWNDHMHRGRKTEHNTVLENRTRRILLDKSLKQQAHDLICEMAEIR